MGVTAALAGFVVLGPGAASAQLPVPVPSVVPEVRVQTPEVRVETPRLPVPAPQVRVQVPSARVETPRGQLPQAQVQTPQVRVQTPQARVQTPQARVQTPQRPSVTTPPAADATPPSGSRPAGRSPAAPSASGAGSRPAQTQAAAGGPTAAPNSSASAPRAAGGAERPAADGRRDATARPRADRKARAAGPRRERRLRRTVARFAGCLDAIAALPRKVLTLRAGVGKHSPRSRRAVAARLDTTVRRVARAERDGLRQLRDSARSGRCGGVAPDHAAAAPAIELGGGGTTPPPLPASTEREARAEARPAASGVKEEFRTSGRPDPETPLPPPSDATEPPIMLLVIVAFVIGFAAMWARERGWSVPLGLGSRRAR